MDELHGNTVCTQHCRNLALAALEKLEQALLALALAIVGRRDAVVVVLLPARR